MFYQLLQRFLSSVSRQAASLGLLDLFHFHLMLLQCGQTGGSQLTISVTNRRYGLSVAVLRLFSFWIG
jgi:hypothetical protein